MKHQGKQVLAWFVAIGASGAIFGGAGLWSKKMAAKSQGHQSVDLHGDSSHGATHGSSEGNSHKAGATHDEHSTGQSHAKVDGHETGKSHDAADNHGDSHNSEQASSHAVSSHEESKHKIDPEHRASTEHAGTNDHKTATSSHNDPSHTKKNDDQHTQADSHSGQGSKGSEPKEKHGTGVHWSYEKNAAEGPKNWGNLGESFAQCEKGREQSPIDLKGAITKASAPEITWHYNPTAVGIENNGHTIVANMPDTQNHIKIDGEKYTLAQFHFHNPSEHKIGGLLADMEVHFVHKNAAGGLAVIGVMMHEKSGFENPFLKPMWASLPREMHSKSEASPTLSLTKLLPTHRDYFHYAGSLTTPPCSQGVRWFVMKEPIAVSGAQIELYSSIFGTSTNRPVSTATLWQRNNPE
ncbi:MAG: carbonic anhydrase family protein [Proteobacteria bacterium]|nr:carbonic anhydrase family protein [Pseudomonadota bacterium]